MATLKKVVKTGGVTHLAQLSGLATSNYPNLDFITSPHDVYNVTETQKLDWLRGQLKQRLGEYTAERPLYVFCGSWNVNAKKPPSDLTKWLIPGPIPSPLADPSFKQDRNAAGNQMVDIMPDIYALGFQEVVDLKIGTGAAALGNNKQTKQAAKNWESGIMGVLGADRYTLVKAKHLVGLSLHVYVKNELLPHIQDLRHEKVGVGFMGVGGNKGGVTIRFRIHDSSYVFINSHLAAHASKCDARNQDFKSILERVKFHTSHVPVHAFPFQVINAPHPSGSKISSQQYNQQQQSSAVVATAGLEHHQYQAAATLATLDPQSQKNQTGGKDASNTTALGNAAEGGRDGARGLRGAEKKAPGDSGRDGARGDYQMMGSMNGRHHGTDVSEPFESLNIARHVNYLQPTEKITLNGIPIIHSQHTQPFPHPGATMSITQHDNCFWVGDLNYRLNVPLADIHLVYQMVSECEAQPPLNLLDHSNYFKQSSAPTHYAQPIRYSKLLHLDQLLQAKAMGQAFVDWHEGIIDFGPTYKYLPGTTQWDPEHKRIPSWCDRIQWIGSDITQLAYQSVPLTISDHFPVRGVFRTVSRSLDLYKKILFVQLLLKHYLAMQILSSPRLMFSQSIYSLGYLHYDVPVISQLVLFNPTKKTLFWRLVSPYDAKHIIDDNDVKKLTSRSHLAPSSQQIPHYYSSQNHHHGLVSVHGGSFKGQGYGPVLDDRTFQQGGINSTHSGPNNGLGLQAGHSNALTSQSPFPQQMVGHGVGGTQGVGTTEIGLGHHQQGLSQQLGGASQQQSGPLSQSDQLGYDQDQGEGQQSSFITPMIKKQQLQLQHHLIHTNQLGNVQASLKRTGFTTQSGATQHGLQLSYNTMVAGAHPGNLNNIHTNPNLDKFLSNTHNLDKTADKGDKNPLFRTNFQQQIFIPHESFQYRQTHKKTNSLIASAQVIPPQPHLITYIPQRNDPYTHLHPSWLKFQQLQGKIGPGQLLTLPYLVHVKRHDALKMTANKQQLSTTLFFATSFSPLNANHNMAMLSSKESSQLLSHYSLQQAGNAVGSSGGSNGISNASSPPTSLPSQPSSAPTTLPTGPSSVPLDPLTGQPSAALAQHGSGAQKGTMNGVNGILSGVGNNGQNVTLTSPAPPSLSAAPISSQSAGPASSIMSSGLHGDFNHGMGYNRSAGGILKNPTSSPHNPLHTLIDPSTVNRIPTTYNPSLTGVSVNLAPSHLSLSMQQRSFGVNVFTCRLQGTFQYSTYGLSLAFLCDAHDSIRSIQVQQALISQVNGIVGGSDGLFGNGPGGKDVDNINDSNKNRNNTTKPGPQTDINSMLSSQNRHFQGVTKPAYEAKFGSQFQQQPQPIPKEFFQLVNALVKTGLDNPKHYIMCDFQESIEIANATRGRPSKDSVGGVQQRGTTTTQQQTTTSSTAPQLPPRSTASNDKDKNKDQNQAKNALLSLTQPRSAVNSGINNNLFNPKNATITKSPNNTVQYVGKQRLHLHTICPRVDNFLLHAALVTCIDEQHPIPVDNYKNTSIIWFTILDLLFNLPEPLFPLGLMDKVVKFRSQNQVNGGDAASSLVSSSPPQQGHGPISTVTLTSSSQAPPEMNPYAIIKYLPQPMVEYQKILVQHQLSKLMTSFCFYLLKWLPVSHYNIFIYLLSLIKKIMSLLTNNYQHSGSRNGFGGSNNGSNNQQLVHNGNAVDIERLKHYIITKFTQACCQIKTLYATQTTYALPLAIISHLLNSPDFL